MPIIFKFTDRCANRGFINTTCGVDVAFNVKWDPHGGSIFSMRAVNPKLEDDPVVASDENRIIMKFLELVNGEVILLDPQNFPISLVWSVILFPSYI